jgi:hypothetical protein
MRLSLTSVAVIVLLASTALADSFTSVNEFKYREDNPTSTDVVFVVTMTFTPAADLGGTDNKYEYTVENRSDDLVATLFRVANPDDLPGTMTVPSGWTERTGIQNFLWENGEILPGNTASGFEILTPGLLPNLVTPPFALNERGWIMTHPVGSEERVDVYGPIIHGLSSIIEVYIDIKPGSCPNPFNGRGRGSVPVAIVGSDSLDVTEIDPSSICLIAPGGGIVCALEEYEIKDSTQPFDSAPADCYDCFDADDPANFNCDLIDATDPENPVPGTDGVMDSYCGDGYDDLVVKFDTVQLANVLGTERDACVDLVLIGNMLSGPDITGVDSIVIKTKPRVLIIKD